MAGLQDNHDTAFEGGAFLLRIRERGASTNALMAKNVKLGNTEQRAHRYQIQRVWMPKVTRATKMLEQAGIAFTVHRYNYDRAASRIGLWYAGCDVGGSRDICAAVPVA